MSTQEFRGNFRSWLPVTTSLLVGGASIVWACPDFGAGAPRGDRRSQPISLTPRGGGPESIGQWQSPRDWPAIAIHGAMMPTGEVLHYSYPDSSDGSRAVLWNHVTGTFTDVNWNTDIFCSGLSHMSDGRLYVAGGNNTNCTFQGRFVTQTFDPFTRTWTSLGEMITGRWYPNVIQLADSRMMITSGLDENCTLTNQMEIYTPGVGLEQIPGGTRFWELFPRTHVLTSGLVAHVGPEDLTAVFDPVAEQWSPVDFSSHGFRDSGTSVLFPGREDQVMIIGGYSAGSPSTSCELIDFNDTESGWVEYAPLNIGRAHANVVILPDRKLLLIGGGTFDLYGGPVLNMEIFDPDTESWTLGPAQVYGRMYHSTALLLPDGRVISAGQDSGESSYKGEIYEPPYLFKGSRPVIESAPTQMGYSNTYTIASQEAENIASVALIALGSQTHSVNTHQRYVGLDIVSATSTELEVVAPQSSNHAPRGYYMLFIVDGLGVPSVATMVQVGDFAPPSGCDGDANGDGVVDPLDAGYIQARFGCPVGTGDSSCDAANVNEDGVVDPLDVGFVQARFGDCE